MEQLTPEQKIAAQAGGDFYTITLNLQLRRNLPYDKACLVAAVIAEVQEIIEDEIRLNGIQHYACNMATLVREINMLVLSRLSPAQQEMLRNG